MVQKGYREFTREEVKKCVAKLKSRMAEGEDQRVNQLIKYPGEINADHDGYVV